MSIRGIIPLSVVCLLLPVAAWGEMDVRLQPETASLFIYEPFTLRLEVECDAPPETPELPLVPDLVVTTIRRLPSDPTRREHAFQIELMAEREGVLTLPPFRVLAGPEAMSTSPLHLRIRAPRSAGEMSLEISVEPTTLRVGQPAMMTVTWTSAVSFGRCKRLFFEIPLLADQRCHVFPLDPSASNTTVVGLPVNNIRVVAQAGTAAHGGHSLSLRYTLVPQVSCVLRASTAQLLCALLEGAPASGESPGHFYSQFFETPAEHEVFEEVYLTAPVPEIIVRDLPEGDRLACFASVVGPCSLHASVAPTTMIVGQASLLTVHLDNLDFARHIGGLPAAAFDGLRPEFQLSREAIRESATDHSHSFTYILRPLHAAVTRIPAVVLQTFDPISDTYRVLRSEPVPIRVKANPADASRVFVPRIDSEAPIRLHGVRQNQLGERKMISIHGLLDFFGRLWWLFVPLPPLLWLALLPTVRRRDRCRHDPAYARAIRAWSRFRCRARRDEESAWRHYLADRLGLSAEALTASSVTSALCVRKVDADLIAETRQRLEERDATDYGRRPPVPLRGARGLVRRLQKATAPLLLVPLLLVPWSAHAADGADELFARAMQLREDRPDEAQPIFMDAALQFESAERFLNAGNSWYFAGEIGRALANYRAAERRTPFNRQLRESIEFLRVGRADAFPSPAAPGGRLATAWNRYCTWMPSLRIGASVLAYLVAWGLFLTARLTGRRVHRAVWTLLLVVILLPLVSLVHSSLRHTEGVVIENTVARLGPGYAYDPAFEQPLHKATEFLWMEARRGWVHVRLPDDSEGWLRESECMKVK